MNNENSHVKQKAEQKTKNANQLVDEYIIPIVGTIVIHVLLFLVVYYSWQNKNDTKIIFTSSPINAALISATAMQSSAPKQKEPPKTLKKTNPETKIKLETEAKVEKQNNNKEVKIKAEEEKKERERKEKERKEAERKKQQQVKEEAERKRQQQLAEEAEKRRQEQLAREAAAAAEQARIQADREGRLVKTHVDGIKDKIQNSWYVQSNWYDLSADVTIELASNGEVVSVTIIKSSGNEAFDISLEQTIFKAEKFDVPTDYKLFENKFRNITLTFAPERQ